MQPKGKIKDSESLDGNGSEEEIPKVCLIRPSVSFSDLESVLRHAATNGLIPVNRDMRVYKDPENSEQVLALLLKEREELPSCYGRRGLANIRGMIVEKRYQEGAFKFHFEFYEENGFRFF